MERQKCHFTPVKGWINDPNGLIYIDGVYHMFYQYYPYDTKWGPMHWGHAVSRDLINWEHKETALFPEKDEYIFSGSAVLDKENLLGLEGGSKAPLLLFYTSHNPETGEQMQSLAYSFDYEHFTKYKKNPVIPNRICETNSAGDKKDAGEYSKEYNRRYKKDFRDPKIFRNNIKGGYSMVLAAGEKIEFYHSYNFKDWEFTGDFIPGLYGIGGICECPDLILLKIEGSSGAGIVREITDREEKTYREENEREKEEAKRIKEEKQPEKYVLAMSMIYKEEGQKEETNIMQYFVGSFDGNTFYNEQKFDEIQLLDFGKDNYAMVSFMDSPVPLMMGWGENWGDARKNNATEYFGKMTLAREVSLIKVKDRILIRQEPVISLKENTESVWKKELVLRQGEMICVNDKLKIINEGDYLCINEKKIKRICEGDCGIIIIYDNGYCEVFADTGIISYSRNLS